MSWFQSRVKHKPKREPLRYFDFNSEALRRVLSNLDREDANEVARELNRRVATKSYLPPIKSVIYNDPATIVLFEDGTKSVVKCRGGDIFSPHVGLAMAITKKAMGNRKGYDNLFAEFLPENEV